MVIGVEAQPNCGRLRYSSNNMGRSNSYISMDHIDDMDIKDFSIREIQQPNVK